MLANTPESVSAIRALVEAGHSQRDVARITGLGKSTVGDLLRGRYELSATRAQAVGGRITQHAVRQQLTNLRDQGFSVREIARLAGIGKSTVHDVLKGKYDVSPAKASKTSAELSAPRGMRLLTPNGFVEVMPLHKRDWSLVGQHGNAVQKYLETGNPAYLIRFIGKTVRTTTGEFELVTDPAVIKRLAKQGSMDVDDIVIGESPGQKRRRPR